jgi:hypothetical protein
MKNNIFPLNLNDDHVDSTFNEKELKHIFINNNSSSSINSDETSSEIKLCEIPFIYKKEKYLVDNEQNKIISLYATFKYLKEKYGLKNTRKYRIDCIIKKVKSKFLKGLHEVIKYCVNLYIKRLPQYFITNIKIEYNKKYLNKTIEQIYTEFKILPSLNELVEKNLIKKGKKDLVVLLMNTMLKDVYKYYLSSELYKYSKLCIRNKEGEKIDKLYDYIAQNICQYFLYNKGNKTKIINNDVNNEVYNKKVINNEKIIIQNNLDVNNIKYECNKQVINNKSNALNVNNNCKNKFKVLRLKESNY